MSVPRPPFPSTDKNAWLASLLGRALGLLSSEECWVQRKKRDRGPDGTRRYSLEGALEKVCGPTIAYGRAIRHGAVMGLISAAIGETDITKWNDQPGRRYEDVVVALKRAIQLAPLWAQYALRADGRSGLTLEVRSGSSAFAVAIPRGRLTFTVKDETHRILSTLFCDTRSPEATYLDSRVFTSDPREDRAQESEGDAKE